MQQEISERFMHSYGGWSELCTFMQAVEFLKLQALCRQTYRTSIARVQMRLTFRKQGKIFALSAACSKKFA